VAFNRRPEERFRFLEEMFEVLGDIVVGRDGEILKYLGDAMLCMFGAGCELRAVECALALRRAFGEIGLRNGLPPDVELEIGIGSGEVTLGMLRHRSPKQRDVAGEEVNRAAAIGHHRGIAITEPVWERVAASCGTRRLPDFSVKWQDRPLRIWKVVEQPSLPEQEQVGIRQRRIA
jgi:class 3 adenylate cyclase